MPKGFRHFIAPELGFIAFWVLACVGGVGAIASRNLGVIFGAIVAIVLLRVIFEAMTVLFQIHGVLTEIRDRLPDPVLAEHEAKLERARQIAQKAAAHARPVAGESRLE